MECLILPIHLHERNVDSQQPCWYHHVRKGMKRRNQRQVITGAVRRRQCRRQFAWCQERSDKQRGGLENREKPLPGRRSLSFWSHSYRSAPDPRDVKIKCKTIPFVVSGKQCYNTTFWISMFFPSKKFFRVGYKVMANNFKMKQGGKQSQIFFLHYSLFYFSVVSFLFWRSSWCFTFFSFFLC